MTQFSTSINVCLLQNPTEDRKTKWHLQSMYFLVEVTSRYLNAVFDIYIYIYISETAFKYTYNELAKEYYLLSPRKNNSENL
jgi:hypothetical protein